MTILVQDSFNRVDGTNLGVADTGQSWVQWVTNTIKLISNQAKVSTTGDGFAVINSGQSDVTLQVTHANYHAWDKILWRYTDQNNYYWVEANLIRKKVDGVQTNIGTLSANINETIKIVTNGNTHTIYMNDVQLGTFTDSFNQTATYHGFALYSGTFDNFFIDGTGVPTGTLYTTNLSDSVGTSETFTKRFSGFKSLSDAITTGESVSKSFSAMVIDTIATGDGTNEGSAKSFSDTVLSADSLAYTQGKSVSLADSIAISEAISKALTKWQTDGISTGDLESEATSRRLSDAITQTDVITAFGGKSVILTEGITVSDLVAKAVARSRSDGLGLAESLGKQLSVRLYDVVISTDAVSTYLPNIPEYRHVMRFPVRLNTRQTVNVTITQRKQFDVDI